MVIYFVGGAIGSATTGLAYGTGGWPAVVVLGAGYSGAALVLWIISEVTGVGHRRGAGTTGTLPHASAPG
jgi:hypothetical protein